MNGSTAHHYAAHEARGRSVVLVDDHTMLRQGLRRSLESEGVIVLAEAADGERASPRRSPTTPTWS